jgi:acylphosphatase
VSPAALKRLHAVVRGRVQGVGFRATTEYEGRKLGLSGWVRNRADGTVEVEAEGPVAALETFLSFLQRGPLGAHVDAVEAQWLAPQGGGPHPFEVRRTT